MAADELDRGQARVMGAVRHASEAWAQAMLTHKLAPPDSGFASRLRALAEAAETEQVACEHADAAGLRWRPMLVSANSQPPYELRPGTGRRGPDELWGRFDRAVARLNVAISGPDAASVADAFGAVADVTHALADAVAAEDARAAAAEPAHARDFAAASADATEDALRARGAA
jgi:hypothetical protein